MREGKDIVAISIPFSAGVATAAFLPPGTVSPYLAAGACCTAAAVSVMLHCRKGDRTTSGLAMFFFSGMLCSFTATVSISTAGNQGQLPQKALEALTGVIERCSFIHDQTGPLVKALITGQRSGLASETIRAFRDSGAAHILSLSGLHMGVIYGILHKCLAWTGRSRAAAIVKAAFTIAATGFFTVMTGCGPSVCRAFLFILINELSRLLPGRRRRPLAVLCTAMMIQLVMEPMVIKSLSFQLSYLSMLAIFTLFPAMASWYPGRSGRDPMKAIWKSAAMSISCQLFTAPLVWLHFRTLPVYFLIANLIALPLSEILMVCSVITIAAEAAGICPEMLKGLTDILAQALVKSLGTISSL